MSTHAWRNTAIGLGVTCLLLLGCLGVLGWRHLRLSIEVVFASEQTSIFDDMRTQALESVDPEKIRSSLEYTERYYPSGTKQRTGSTLDKVVERHRVAVLRDIRAHLDQVERSKP